MSDPTQNPPPDESAGQESQAPGQGSYGTQQPPPGGYPPPPPGQGSYGTQPPPGQGGYGTQPPPPPPGGWQQPGAMPPPVRPTGGVGQPADLLPRFVARLIDFLLLGFVEAIVVTFIILGLVLGLNAGNVGGVTVGTGAGWTARAVSAVLNAAIALGYFTLMEAKLGQTVGKMLMRLRTEGPGGARPTMAEAVRRNAFVAIGVLGVVPLLGFLGNLLMLAAVITIAITINNDRVTRHGWHDNFAGGTTVIRIG